MSEDAPPRPTEPFVHRRRLCFGDTDAAGIVYTPRVAHFGIEAVEAWFLERLGIEWVALNQRRRLGTPFVRMEVDFVSPMKPPEVLATEVRLDRAGRSSLAFRLVAHVQDRLCWRGAFTCAFISVETYRSVPIPPDCAEAVAHEAALARA